MTRDTYPIDVQHPVELNRYGYTANNPVNGTDPSGEALISYASANRVSTPSVAGVAYVGSWVWCVYSLQASAFGILNAGERIGGMAGCQFFPQVLWARSHEDDLPTDPNSEYPYRPPKNARGKPKWNKERKGFEDDKGNIWVWDKSGHRGGHWDVQNPKDDSHTNVDRNGKQL
ncbi:hypothetical protein HC928_08345 [bacterium]|nr:hypothetical protein [bacterium]